ncbi:MAG: hypothetical protein KJO29_11335, partial [Bacteroidia bacterium]|nr:hypothetical protein [Bacteroidia bacterium]
YFDEIGPYGRKMMVQSCSMHINLDFGEDWDTRISRFILSNLLVPFSSVLFANSAIVSGKKSMHKSYRRFLWNHLDPTRTGILDLKGLSGLPDKDWVIDRYLEFVLNAPLIYIEGTDESEAPLKISLDKWLKKPVGGRYPVLADLENHLSLLFPEVRPKGYLEIRTVDVPPKGWEFVPLIFYTGLLYHQHTMEKAINLLLPLSRDLNGMIHDASYGYKTDRLYSFALALVNYAIEGYNCLPAKFKGDIPVDHLIEFKESYVLNKLCFADDSIMNYSSK